MSKTYRLIVETNKASQDYDIYLEITQEAAREVLHGINSLKEYSGKSGIDESRPAINIDVTGYLADMCPSELESYVEYCNGALVYAVVEDREYWKVKKFIQVDSVVSLRIYPDSIFAQANYGAELIETENILGLVKRMANGEDL